MKGVYLCCGRARHFDFDIDYVDIDSRFGNIVCDALSVDLSSYDFLIATPPCNWWTRANPYYMISDYSLKTKHLLPDIIKKFGSSGKPFLIENVINKKRMLANGVFQLASSFGMFCQFVGRHTYWTDSVCDLSCPQHQDFRYGGRRVNSDGHNQGGSNVHIVIDKWLKLCVCQ